MGGLGWDCFQSLIKLTTYQVGGSRWVGCGFEPREAKDSQEHDWVDG